MEQETKKYSVWSVIIVKKSEQPDQLNTEISFNSLQVAQPTHWTSYLRLNLANSQNVKPHPRLPASRADQAAEGICENKVSKLVCFCYLMKLKWWNIFFDKKLENKNCIVNFPIEVLWFYDRINFTHKNHI